MRRRWWLVARVLALLLGATAVGLALGNELDWDSFVVRTAPCTHRLVALTFDDGPHPEFTPEILAMLDRLHVKATFFMIGQEMDRYPEIVRLVAAKGHAIGNHTYTHPHNLEACSQVQVAAELERCEHTIERLTGRRTRIFRPPRGLLDESVFAVATREGFRTILWTVCADHHDAPTPPQMAKRVLAAVRPGAIILAHDGTFASRWKDVAATPLIVRGLQARGYRFVTVPELLAHLAAARAQEVTPARRGWPPWERR